MLLSDLLALAILFSGVFFWPLSVFRSGTSKLGPGSGLEPLPPEQILPIYERGRWRRISAKIASIIAYILILFALTSSERIDVPFDVDGGILLCAAVLPISYCLGTFLRYRNDVSFVSRSPLLADSLMPLTTRIILALLGALPLSMILAAASTEDLTVVMVGMVVAVTVAILQRRFLMRVLLKDQVIIQPESPFAQQMAKVQEQFGVVPKRLVVIPMTMANAFAAQDGTVMVTTMARVLLTEDEICAVVAHELSHIKDSDVKKLQRWRLLLMVPVFMSAFTGYGVSIASGNRAGGMVSMIVATLLGWMVYAFPFSAYLASRSRKIEFKCDVAAKAVGYGPALATGIEKLYRYLGIPNRLGFPDTILHTHPSVEDRVRALASAG